jgi:hypothetical protein
MPTCLLTYLLTYLFTYLVACVRYLSGITMNQNFVMNMEWTFHQVYRICNFADCFVWVWTLVCHNEGKGKIVHVLN